MFTQFEGEVISRLNNLTEVCTSNANFSEVYALSNNFRSWIEVSSEKFEFMFLKEAKRNFHAKVSGIVEPLLQKIPPTFLLPTLEVTSPHSPIQPTLVASETTLLAGSGYGVTKTKTYDEVIMKTLEHLEAENFEVKERLKQQGKKTSKIEGVLGLILSRLPPLLKPWFLKYCVIFYFLFLYLLIFLMKLNFI